MINVLLYILNCACTLALTLMFLRNARNVILKEIAQSQKLETYEVFGYAISILIFFFYMFINWKAFIFWMKS